MLPAGLALGTRRAGLGQGLPCSGARGAHPCSPGCCTALGRPDLLPVALLSPFPWDFRCPPAPRAAERISLAELQAEGADAKCVHNNKKKRNAALPAPHMLPGNVGAGIYRRLPQLPLSRKGRAWLPPTGGCRQRGAPAGSWWVRHSPGAAGGAPSPAARRPAMGACPSGDKLLPFARSGE